MDKTCLVIKVLIILILVLFLINLYRKSQDGSMEGFQQIDYMKLSETYVESEDTNLKLLYANYDGEEVGEEVWKNKTLEQCVDLCNNLDGCKGFTRYTNLSDTATGECQPRTKLGLCHSVRKGEPQQMQNAIKYNTYIKNIKNSQTNNILTKCIGDPNMTLNRMVYIKSYKYPNKFIGTLGDGLSMLIDKNDTDFDLKCKYKIMIGKDGIGTISFLHVYSNKLLYRSPSNNSSTSNIRPNNSNSTNSINPTNTNNTNNTKNTNNSIAGMNSSMSNEDFLGFKDISNLGTVDQQRASFNIIDSMKNQMKFRCMRVDGESTDKYISISSSNSNYLVCTELGQDESIETFNIVDNVVSSKIINNKDKLDMRNSNTTSSSETMAMHVMPTQGIHSQGMPQSGEVSNMNNDIGKAGSNAGSKESFFAVDAIGNKIIQKSTTDTRSSKLDTTSDISLYNNIFNPSSVVKVNDYLSDNFGENQFNKYTSIDKTMNDIVLQNQLSRSLDKNKNTYNAINQLNQEIEREIAGLNMDLNGKNDKVVNNIGRMQLSDMAKDYYTLKNVYPESLQ